MAEIELTLNSPITEEQWDAITDVDFDNTSRIWFHTKHGKQVEFIKAKPVTSNADRIRAMSDEELAEEMSVRLSEDCLMCPVLYADCPVWESKDIECRQAMLDWLKQEARDD